MKFKEKLDSLVSLGAEVSDLRDINVEWYKSVSWWRDYLWTLVNRQEPYKVKEGVETLKASILDLSDEISLKRFRDAGSNPTYHRIGIWKIGEYLDEGNYTHVFIKEIGELSDKQIEELKEWIKERV